jgi:tetratricopeptide (TPR) repeat protein
LVRGELDWIVMKALEKGRNRRYETANALAMDVQRYLTDEPVQACPPSGTYRLRKFARRHGMALATAAAFALLLIAATGVSTWQAVRAMCAEGLAEERLSQTKKAQAATQVALEQSEAVSKFLTEAFRSPDPSQDGRQVKVADVLDRAVARLDRDLTGSPTIRGALLNTLGETYDGLGLSSLAASVFEKACLVRESALGPDHPDTLTSRMNIGNAYRGAGRSAEAIPLLEESLKQCEVKLGSDHLVTLTTRESLGSAYRDAGRTTEAIRILEGTLEQCEAKLGPDHPLTLMCRNDLALEYRDAGRTTEAIPLLKGTLKQCEAKLGPDHPQTLNSRDNLGDAYQAAGRAAVAICLLEDNLKRCEAKLGPDHEGTLSTRNNLALAYGVAGRAAEAIRLHEETLKQCKAKLGPDHSLTLTSLDNLVVAYDAAGRAAEAIPLLEQAFHASGKSLKRRPVGALLLAMYGRAGRAAEAARLVPEVLADARKTFPKDSSQLAGTLAQSGDTLLQVHAYADAEPLLRECLALREKTEPDAWTTFNAQSMLGRALLGQEKYAEAEPLVVAGYEGLKAHEAGIPPLATSRLPEAAERVVKLYDAWGKKEKAAEWRAKLARPNDEPKHRS